MKQQLRPNMSAALSAAADGVERSGVTEWDFGDLPRTFEQRADEQDVKAFPALVDEGESVGVRMFGTEAEQRAAGWAGTRRMLLMAVPSPVKSQVKGLSTRARLVFSRSPHGDVAALVEDCVGCAVDKIVAENGGPVWEETAFGTLKEKVRVGIGPYTAHLVSTVEKVLTAAQQVDTLLAERGGQLPAEAREDITTQLSNLIHPGFVTATGWDRLPDLTRYLRGIEHRLDKLPQNPRRDRDLMDEVHQVEDRYQGLLDGVPQERPVSDELRRIGWMIEDLRVSFFAQSLGTPQPVSVKRLHKAMDTLL